MENQVKFDNRSAMFHAPFTWSDGKVSCAREDFDRVIKDAGRYQWLRHNGAKFPEPIGCMTEVLCDEDLDAAIDATIQMEAK